VASSIPPPRHCLPGGKSFPAYHTSYVQPLPTPPADQYPPSNPFDRQNANVAAAVAFPSSMSTFPDANSFTSRRPNASALPTFELPPPPLSSLQTKFHPPAYQSHSTHSVPTTLTSVGNLLTPPSNSSLDGLSPASGATTTSSLASHPYTPGSYTTNSSAWSAPASTPYGFQSAAQQFSRGHIFSPSLNSIVRGTHSPTASESLPPPPYELPQYSAPMSMPMSAPSLPSVQNHHHHHQQQHQMIGSAMMGGSAPASAVTQPSPVHSQDAFSRPPPTPSFYGGSQPSSTPQQSTFPYSSGPSPVLQSPGSAGGHMARASPVNGHGSMPPLHSQQQPQSYQQRAPFQYPLLGPVLSNVGNPNGQLSLVNGMSHHGMPMHYNSGHAAMQQLYGHPMPQHNPQTDRPFRCDQCPQSFNRNHDLKRHKRIHLAVKPFPCGHCDKSFSRKDALKVRLNPLICSQPQSQC
jgi:hypothetical protein